MQSKVQLRKKALIALHGIGDLTAGEWEEWTGRAYHVRRRLTPDEERMVGPAVDIRGTAEVLQRYRNMAPYVSDFVRQMAIAECGKNNLYPWLVTRLAEEADHA